MEQTSSLLTRHIFHRSPDTYNFSLQYFRNHDLLFHFFPICSWFHFFFLHVFFQFSTSPYLLITRISPLVSFFLPVLAWPRLSVWPGPSAQLLLCALDYLQHHGQKFSLSAKRKLLYFLSAEQYLFLSSSRLLCVCLLFSKIKSPTAWLFQGLN